MKGLLYKEFYLGRKNYLAFLALAFVFALLGVLVCLSMICGNLQSLPIEDPEGVKVFVMIFTYAPYSILLATLFCGCQSVYGDQTSGFMQFSYTLPVKAEVTVGALYLIELIILGAGLLFGNINAGIISAMTNIPLSAGTVKNMVVILACAVLLYAWELPLAFRFKNPKTVSAIMVVIGGGIYLAAGALFFTGMKQFTALADEAGAEAYLQMMMNKFTDIRDMIFPFLPFLIFAVMGISFFLSVKFCKRREK